MSDPIAEKTRETFTQRALEAFKKVPNNRHYALDFKSENEVGAVLLAYRDITLENGGGFDMVELTKVFETLSQDLPGLVQDRPDPEQEIPKLPVDETTGEQALNPWKKGSENLSDQMLVEQRDPKLAAHLKAIANGVSYSLLYKQRDERERREKLRQLRYTGAEHKQNPFHLSGKEGLKAQSAFVKQHEHEPWLIEFSISTICRCA